MMLSSRQRLFELIPLKSNAGNQNCITFTENNMFVKKANIFIINVSKKIQLKCSLKKNTLHNID